jgi:hypothetical protein
MHPIFMYCLIRNHAIFMLRNIVWLHKLFHQHMKTKSALIPGFTSYDVAPVTDNTVAVPPATDNTVAVPPAVAPTIAPAPIPQILTCATTPRTLNPPNPSASEESDDNDGTPVPPPTLDATFDMTDTNTPLTPCLPCDYATWRYFIIQSQVFRVTLNSLHKAMM